ncbi:MAG: TrmH family RNA methyltransferase [Polyangiales bacterium]
MKNGGKSEPKTEVVYGLRAGLAVLAKRPQDVVAIACSRDVRRQIGRGQETPDRELERLAQNKNHEGLVLETRARKWLSPGDLADLLVKKKGVAVALDRVRNPYNVGAILRSAAFFGVDAALLGPIAPHPALAPDAVRVAEGGIEHLAMARTTDLADTLSRLRQRGVRVVGADGAAKENAIGHDFRRPTVLVMGNEREGLGDRVRAQCDAIVAIPGSGAVESLNVAVAAGVLVSELVR